jgi:uncharacterized protein YlzI (FlbEa/FlbD family)
MKTQFIKVKRVSGWPVGEGVETTDLFVNPSHIVNMYSYNGNTRIVFSNGNDYEVTDSVGEILGQIEILLK